MTAGELFRTPIGDSFTHDQALGHLADAMEKLPTVVTPDAARGLQVTENSWRRIEAEGGLVTSSVVSEALGSHPSNRALASKLRRSGQLIGVPRRNRFLYPDFQLDPALRQIKPIIPDLIAIAAGYGYPHIGLLFWMYEPTTYFDDDSRPIDHLESEELLLEVARSSMGIVW